MDRIVVFGEDVADCSREEYLKDRSLRAKAAVFKLTSGLQMEFVGRARLNSPLAEANIVGRAIGMAPTWIETGSRIQFFDYNRPAYHQIRMNCRWIRWRSNGNFSVPR